jgi:hypothetical protein
MAEEESHDDGAVVVIGNRDAAKGEEVVALIRHRPHPAPSMAAGVPV